MDKIGPVTKNLCRICLTQKLVGTTVYILLNRANRPDVLLEDLISSIYMRDNFKANDALVTVLCENMLFNNNNANRINV